MPPRMLLFAYTSSTVGGAVALTLPEPLVTAPSPQSMDLQ